MVYIGVKMNDLIKELAGQAGYFIKFQMNEKGETFLVHTKEPGIAGDLALFSKLIVQECVEVLSDKRFDNVRPTMSIAQAMIKQHFGVKE